MISCPDLTPRTRRGKFMRLSGKKVHFIAAVIFSVMIFGMFSAGSAAENEVAAKLGKTVKLFENVYKIDSGIVSPATVAVFGFQCGKKLADRGIGFAVAELISHRLVASGNFKVVEREALSRIIAYHAGTGAEPNRRGR